MKRTELDTSPVYAIENSVEACDGRDGFCGYLGSSDYFAGSSDRNGLESSKQSTGRQDRSVAGKAGRGSVMERSPARRRTHEASFNGREQTTERRNESGKCGSQTSSSRRSTGNSDRHASAAGSIMKDDNRRKQCAVLLMQSRVDVRAARYLLRPVRISARAQSVLAQSFSKVSKFDGK